MAYFDRVNTFCLFVSPARSGHSIIGQLLCAHPDVVVSDELGAVTMIDEGMSADQVYALIRTQDLNLQARGRAKSGYDYRVGAAQNRTDKQPLVMGDAKGARATSLLADDETFLTRLREAVGVPIRAIVHLRNPFDIVGSRVKRRGRNLDEAIQRVELLHAELLKAVERLGEDERLIQHHEDVIGDPAGAFRRMFAFLGVKPDERVVKACAGKLWQRPRTARKQADWSADAIDRMRRLIDGNPLLAPYREPAEAFTPTSVPAAAPDSATDARRARDEDRSRLFDRVERFVLLLSPHARGVVQLAGVLSQHPEVMIGGELVDELYELPCLTEPYDGAQLLAVIRHLRFLREARDRHDQGDERRSVQVYRELAERRPRVMGLAPSPSTLRRMVHDSKWSALSLEKRLGLPVSCLLWSDTPRGTQRGGVATLAGLFAPEDQHRLAADELLGEPRSSVEGVLHFLEVDESPSAIDACTASLSQDMRAGMTADLPAWVGPAAWLKSRAPGLVAKLRR
ncbi:MAG: hypothetical protein AAGI54_02630 [Planctomycetota bacterium]